MAGKCLGAIVVVVQGTGLDVQGFCKAFCVVTCQLVMHRHRSSVGAAVVRVLDSRVEGSIPTLCVVQF